MFKQLLSRHRQRALISGLDIGNSDIHLVEISGQQQLKLERYASTRLPVSIITDEGIDDLERLIDIVRTLRETCDAQSRRVAISLPTAMTSMACWPLQIVSSDDDQLETLARTHVAELLPYPITQASIDFSVLAPTHSGAPSNLFVAAIRQEIIDDIVAMAEALALETVTVNIASYADYAGWMHIQALAPAMASPKRIAMLRIENIAVHCSLFEHGHLCGDKAICRSLVTPKGMTATPLPQTVAHLLRTAMTQTGTSQLDQIVLSGSNTCITDLKAILQQQTRIDTFVAPPFAGIEAVGDNHPRTPDTQALTSYLTACGVALRGTNTSGTAT